MASSLSLASRIFFSYSIALSIAVEIGDKRGEGNRRGHLGGIFIEKARRLPEGPERSQALQDAQESITAAIRLCQKVGDLEKEGTWLMNLGIVFSLEGATDDAIKYFTSALSIAKQRGFSLLTAQTHFNLGATLAPSGQLRAALEHFRSAGVLLYQMRSPLASKADLYVRRLEAMLVK